MSPSSNNNTTVGVLNNYLGVKRILLFVYLEVNVYVLCNHKIKKTPSKASALQK